MNPAIKRQTSNKDEAEREETHKKIEKKKKS